MKIYILSDLHLGAVGMEDKVHNGLTVLCRQIRSEASNDEKLLFIILGDLIDKGQESAFAVAKDCLEKLCSQLHDFNVCFEMVPGNHDRSSRDVSAFDRFIAGYQIQCAFTTQTTGSKILALKLT